MAYEFGDDSDFRTSHPELMGALGADQNDYRIFHPDYFKLLQAPNNTAAGDAQPFASTESIESEETEQSK